MVRELQRVTLLWDELWLGTLNQHHQDVGRRLNQLENEVKKVNNNSSLTAEEKTLIIKKKHNTVLKPVSFVVWLIHTLIVLGTVFFIGTDRVKSVFACIVKNVNHTILSNKTRVQYNILFNSML